MGGPPRAFKPINRDGGDEDDDDGDGDEFEALSPGTSRTKAYLHDEPAAAGHKRALVVSIVCFGSITIAQFVASFFAHSDALRVDCASMFVDVCTYIANYIGESPECAVRGRRAASMSPRRRELAASAFSLAVLYAVTVAGLVSALLELADAKRHAPAQDKVDPKIILAFGILGMTLDVVSLCAFFRESVCSGDGRGSANVFSALAHILADSLRSLATTAEALGILYFGSAPEKTDAWTTLVVSATIVVGSCGAMRLWCIEASEECANPSEGGSNSAPHRYEMVKLPCPDPRRPAACDAGTRFDNV
ncbi:hypothetical protein M885DRAFT_617317 [Pelagophyceae sp. CCMP2097]|nr:hypothetical protein M885DRAFT_617317 [Pelagophyceae sp. CCMP2097]